MSETTIHAASWLLNPHSEPQAGGAIAIRDGVIIAAGTRDELLCNYGTEVIDHPGCALLPGFVNAHTHLELTHFPAWREQNGMGYSPRRFVDWIIQLVKINRGVSANHFKASLTEGIRKCLTSGTTSVGDIFTHFDLLPNYSALPVGGRLFFELLGHDPLRFNSRLSDALAAVDSMTGGALLPALSPHAPYTISEQHLSLVREAAATRGLPVAIHVAESEAETAFVFDSSGPIAEDLYPFIDWQQYLAPPRRCSSVELLDRLGMLTPATLAVHCVHVTPTDAGILKERDVTVCLCPRSNECLDVGKAPAALYKKLGIRLALGTDSLASNNSLSLWDELRFALDSFGGVLSPEDLFAMVTSGGAAGLGLSQSIGTLEPGKRADFQVVECGESSADRVLERLISHGQVLDVYLGGERY